MTLLPYPRETVEAGFAVHTKAKSNGLGRSAQARGKARVSSSSTARVCASTQLDSIRRMTTEANASVLGGTVLNAGPLGAEYVPCRPSDVSKRRGEGKIL